MKSLGIHIEFLDNVVLEADNVIIDNDDGLEYCVLQNLQVKFKVSVTSSSSCPMPRTKSWPVTYMLPALNDIIVQKIQAASTPEAAAALKNSTSFYSSFPMPIVKDVESYLDEDK